MGLRPAKTMRALQGQVWTRISQKTPRKSFIKGAPKPKVRQYNMGVDRFYERQVALMATVPIQLRDNAMEAARQTTVKYLEKHVAGQYFMTITKYPHVVIREHTALGVAGADRISKGMKLSFGKPRGRLARIKAKENIFIVRVNEKDIPEVREALKRAKIKMSGAYTNVISDITKEKWNIAKIGREVVIKAKVTEEKKPEIAKEGEAKPAEAAGADAKAAEAGKGEEKKGDAKAAGKEEKKK
ncbi:MAG: 50S ribosomal protein L16 [Candidatus Micrarchaeota archaeon]